TSSRASPSPSGLSRAWTARANARAALRRAAEGRGAASARAPPGVPPGPAGPPPPARRRAGAARPAPPPGRGAARAPGGQRGGEAGVKRQAGLDLFEAVGVVVPGPGEVPQRVGDLAGLVGEPFEGLRRLGQRGDAFGERGDRPGDLVEKLLGRAFGLVEQRV